MGYFGSRENILKAKLEILEGLSKNGTVVINNDNDLLHKWNQEEKTPFKVVTYGIENTSDVLGENVQSNENGSIFTAIINQHNYEVKVPVGGEHFVYNSLCAIAVAKLFGIPMNDVLAGIAEFELTKKRMEMKHTKVGALVINDCYNANYDSVKAALDYLGKLQNNRKIAVLGDMRELGEYSKELHEKVAESICQNQIDIFIGYGDEMKQAIQKAKELGMKPENIFWYETKAEITQKLNELMQSEDAILLKASNSLNFSEISNAICE